MSPLLAAFLLLVSMGLTSASTVPLRPGFYSETCPEADFIVKDVMRRNMIREPRSAASVMRFQFHDCFVNVNFIIQTKNLIHVFMSILHYY
jgi:peroxidase